MSRPSYPSFVIKYLGSKRRLVPVLGEMFGALAPRTALDLFTGTTRVAQELKRRGAEVWAVDTARYSEVLAQTYVATDGAAVQHEDLTEVLAELAALPGHRGYFTETFCEASRFVQPQNGMRVDAIRDRIAEVYDDDPILLTSLLEATDRVDSTTGVQMAYLKGWSPRSHRPLELRVPALLAGRGHAVRGDAATLAPTLPPVELAYLDPPYNQHRYFTNYHVWETLIAWDAPAHYGVACKRVDCRDPETKSAFNSKRTMAAILETTIASVRADVLVVSFSNEGFVPLDDLVAMASRGREHTATLAFDSKRYVGAQIGIHNPAGEKVGRVSHLRNLEYVVVAGARERVEAAVAAVGSGPAEALAHGPGGHLGA
jgi:adenine-specific DNA-methyltransferase